MRLSHASVYAIAALRHIVQHSKGKPITSHVIAQQQGIPERFLLKVMRPLVGARIISSVKGPNGGYTLRKPPKDVSLLEIIECQDGPLVPLNGEEIDEDVLELFSAATDAFRAKLSQTKLSSLIKEQPCPKTKKKSPF